MLETSIPKLMESIPHYFVPEKAKGVNSVIHFHLTGEDGGDWTVVIQNQECSVTMGITANPKLVFSASAQDCLDILSGKLDGLKAYMLGKLKLKGDMSLAMKIAGFFKLDQ